MHNRKKILVTGSAGFLGSHLARSLLDSSHEVLCLDNFLTGSKLNVMPLLDNPNFEIIRHDVICPFSLEVDAIYNLACPASPIHYQHDPVQTIKTSILGAINVLDLAKRLKVPVLQASTSEVYGDPIEHPQTEDYWGNVNCNGPRACYDEGKRAAETLFMDYHTQYGVDIRIARIFNTYGPNMDPNDGRVISNFIVQALQEKDITIYGDGNQTRSFCYVEDTINGLIKLMNKSECHTPINIGNPLELSMHDIAKKILELTKSKSKIILKPLPQDDPKKRCPDISKAKALLDWQPKIDLSEGLKKTIDYFQQRLQTSA